jgi:DNA polymerase III delta prime subunit
MRSETKETRLDQKNYWQRQLDSRLAELKEQGLPQGQVSKDAAVRKIRAEMRKATARLQAIANKEKKITDMAEAKAQKAAAPKEKKQKGKKGAEEGAEMSKRQQKKKAKKQKPEAEPAAEE